MLLHPTCHWMMYWSFKNPFTSNLKPYPAGLNDVIVWLMDLGSGYVCRWPGPGSALTHRDTVVKASLAVTFQRSRILMKRFFDEKFRLFFPSSSSHSLSFTLRLRTASLIWFGRKREREHVEGNLRKANGEGWRRRSNSLSSMSFKHTVISPDSKEHPVPFPIVRDVS